jgi:hypothetical protein
MSRRRLPPKPSSYRVVVYELNAHQPIVVMDATGVGFVAAVGTITRPGRMTGELNRGGPPALIEHLALLVANQLTR